MKNRKINRKMAIISCEPDDQEPMKFRGKTVTIREITALRFKALGLEPIIHRPLKDIKDFPDIREYGSVIVGGSKLNISDEDLAENEWMRKLIDFIRDIHGKRPMLGICYGHQAIARAFGGALAKFGPDITYEVGFVPVRLTEEGLNDPVHKGIPPEFDALFSHFYYVSSAPEGSSILVMGDTPSIHSYRVGESTWGIQSHPEFEPANVQGFLLKRRAVVEGLIDVEAALGSMDRMDRVDSLTLRNFAGIVKSD